MNPWGVTPVDMYEEMQRACQRIAADAGVSEKHIDIINLVSFIRVRNAFIRRDYDALRSTGKTDGVKMELAKK